MDSNRTRFLLVLGDDWSAAGSVSGFARTLDADGALTLDPKAERVPLTAGDLATDPALRVGAVVDRHGNTYTVAGAGIRRRPCADGTGELWFWFPGDPEAPTGTEAALHGLALTADDLLVAGRGAELLVFDLLVGGAPRRVAGPAGLEIADLSAAASDVWVLDARSRTAAKVRLRPSAPATAPESAPPAPDAPRFERCQPGSPAGLTAAFGPVIPLPGTSRPIAIAALAAGDAVVLTTDAGASLIRVGASARVILAFAELALQQGWSTAPVGHDLIADGERVTVVDQVGNQAFVFVVGTATAAFTAAFVPLHGYRGHDLVANAGEVRYLSTTVDRWVPMSAMARPRFDAAGSLVVPVRRVEGRDERGWDSGLPGCVWHRVVLDACVPPGVIIEVWARAADQRERFDDDGPGEPLAWRRQPPLWSRPGGAELPHRGQLHAVPTDAFEVLLQEVVGRFLQLRIEVTTDLCSSPRLFALRVYFPRFSYLEHYLPANWREDRAAADFVERFLANPGGIFTEIEDRVAAAQLLFRPELLGPDHLPWLATWFDVMLDPGWDTRKRRFFLANAMHFFARRGTVAGIRAAVRLLIEDCPTLQLFDVSPGGVQILEGAARRRRDGVPGSAAPADGVAHEAAPDAAWTPAEGLPVLDARYLEATSKSPFPWSRPAAGAADWERFCRRHLGFVPRATRADRAQFLEFVARRHGAGARRALEPLLPSQPADQPLFALPAPHVLLADWYDFERLVLPIARAAHRFTVLLPTPDRELVLRDPGHPERLRASVRRVVEAEKPAHTAFDVAFADQWFRPDEVLVGIDTMVGAPDRTGVPPMVLDRGVLGEAGLAPPYPAQPPRGSDGRFPDPIPLELP